MQVWWDWDFAIQWGGQKKGYFVWGGLYVRHAFEQQGLCARLHPEAVAV